MNEIQVKHRIGSLFLLLFLPFIQVISGGERPPEWAQPIYLKGLPNLHKVTPAIYRSAQPSSEGMTMAESLGIKTVINLRHKDDTDIAKNTGLKLRHFPLQGYWINDARIKKALAVLMDETNHPVLVHCKHGADRTGLLIGMYRVAAQGWENEKALDELKKGGYHHHRRYFPIRRYLKKFKPKD